MFNHPIVFIHYPTGAGGRFLAALLQHSISSSPVLIDNNGSGHLNPSARFTTNFYKIISTDTGMGIIHSTSKLSIDDQIQYLQSTFEVRLDCRQIIDLHCTNINIFLAAFPNSKCIQINITPDDMLHCIGNFLVKVILSNPLYLKKLCNHYNISYEQAAIKINNINEYKNLEFFQWVDEYVISTSKNIENQSQFNDRILEIMYSEYINDDIDSVMTCFLSFINQPVSVDQYNSMYKYFLTYRIQQPKFTRTI